MGCWLTQFPGVVGGLVGGWLFKLLRIWHGTGMIGASIVGFVGAVILIWITCLIKKV
jgi:uncharacterized membrane protein YeaQ/YmgE (transglycosylase-associated protein family)